MTVASGKHATSKLLNGAGASIFRVRSGVPMPRPNQIYPFSRMQIGQSFLIPKKIPPNKVRSAACVYAKNHDRAVKFRVCRTGADQFGCWRVK